MSQHPHGMSDIGDLIQSAEVYECFDGNTVEVDIMLDYLTANRITPRYIYREIIEHIQSQPRKFAPLIELDLFADVHSVAAGIDPGADGPRERICRLCATEVLLWGLKDWWIRERKKGFLDESVTLRKDCPDGSSCHHQGEHAHAKEFNHIIHPPEPEPQDVAHDHREQSDPVSIPTQPDHVAHTQPDQPPQTQPDTSSHLSMGNSEADVAAVLMGIDAAPPLASDDGFEHLQGYPDPVEPLF